MEKQHQQHAATSGTLPHPIKFDSDTLGAVL
jgi:hypothetical protein